jgi:hypothetical protein
MDQISEKVQQFGRSLFALYKNKKYLIEFDAQKRRVAFIDIRRGEVE